MTFNITLTTYEILTTRWFIQSEIWRHYDDTLHFEQMLGEIVLRIQTNLLSVLLGGCC